jgi:hypothetical protein
MGGRGHVTHESVDDAHVSDSSAGMYRIAPTILMLSIGLQREAYFIDPATSQEALDMDAGASDKMLVTIYIIVQTLVALAVAMFRTTSEHALHYVSGIQHNRLHCPRRHAYNMRSSTSSVTTLASIQTPSYMLRCAYTVSQKTHGHSTLQ